MRKILLSAAIPLIAPTLLLARPAQDDAFVIDNNHSAAEFRVRHLGVSTVTGEFEQLEGSIWFDPAAPEASRVEVIIQAASINTAVEGRDNHLRSADFFDVEKFPTLTFKSTAVRATGEGTYEVDGDLTIRDVTRTVTLQAELGGVMERQGREGRMQTVGFSAQTRINRGDFELTWNRALEAGGFLVGEEVRINLEVEANRPLATE